MLINYYPKYKEKTKDLLINSYKFEFLLNNNVEMFDHTFNTTTDLKIDRFLIDSIEFKLNMFGICAFFIFNNRLMCEPCFFIGGHNDYGFPKDCYVIVNNNMAKQITFKDWLDNDEVIIMKNNKLGTTDMDIARVSNNMAEVDKSFLANVLNSRLAPLVRVTNQKDKNKVKKIIEHIREGKPEIIDLDPSLLYEENLIDILNITDVDDSSKIQFLDLASESLSKRYYQNNGVNMNSSVKQAQQSIAEITDGTNASFIYPSNKLKARIDCVEEFKEKFNISYSCKFSTCWKQGWEMLNKSIEEKEEGENVHDDVSDQGLDNEPTSDNNNRNNTDNNNV